MRTPLRLALVSALVLIAAHPAAAKSYSADRFDVTARILPDGSLEVTETVVFRFEGRFEHVYHELRTRWTDGIDIVWGTMDGVSFPFGEGKGRLEVSGKSPVKVRWRFNPVSDSTHTFSLKYVMHGVVRRERDADVLNWAALPTKHDYPIGASTIAIALSSDPIADPAVSSRRVADADVRIDGDRVRIDVEGIRKNGWVEASLRFAEGSVIAAAPEWQQRQARADAFAPRWTIAASLVAMAGLMVLFALRQRYDPPLLHPSEGHELAAPDTLPPALAGSLTANGRITLDHAMAALFVLADRGEVSISEDPRGRFGQRSFTVRRQRTGRHLLPHEHVLLDTVFTHRNQQEESVALSKARSRLVRRFGAFRASVGRELVDAGLVDQDRKQVRDRYGRVSLALVLLGTAGLIVSGFLVNTYRGWPILVPGALMLVAIVGFIFQGATTPLSNQGLARAQRWRAYQRHLKEVTKNRAHLTSESPMHLLPFAVALGLATAWSKFLKKHPAGVPAWFQAISADNDGAFAALVAAGAASGDGGAGAGAGAAAGGGASGAG